MDSHANFSYARVDVAPSPADSGTTLDVVLSDDLVFPDVPFNATVWPDGVLALLTNAEIVRVTAISGVTLTIERQQEGSNPRTIVAGDQIAATITKKTLTDVEENSLRATALNGLVAGGAVTGNGGSGLIDLPNNSPEFHNEQLVASINGFLFTMPANTVVGLTGDTTNPRIDVMYVVSPGVIGPSPGYDTIVKQGTAAPSPTRPSMASNELPLAWIDVPANATTSSECILTDARTFVGYVPVDGTGHMRLCGMTSARSDSDLINSEFGLWLDDTPGATALKIKAKDSAGTVRTATVPLS